MSLPVVLLLGVRRGVLKPGERRTSARLGDQGRTRVPGDRCLLGLRHSVLSKNGVPRKAVGSLWQYIYIYIIWF